MTLGDVIKRMHRKYAGDTKYPATGSDKWLEYRDIANDKKDEWATDPDTDWDSTWEERELGIATSATTYDLDEDINNLSDYVYIDKDDTTFKFYVIKSKDRANMTNCAYLSGNDPKVLNFTDMPTDAIGGTIRAGVYAVPEDMESTDDTCPVDRPLWVAYAGAAELAFNDPAKEDQFADLNGMANDEYEKMIDAANSLPAHQPLTVPQQGYGDVGVNFVSGGRFL
jgi:hypothetical protein